MSDMKRILQHLLTAPPNSNHKPPTAALNILLYSDNISWADAFLIAATGVSLRVHIQYIMLIV